jgi:UDP:flavonoid glycosyltransferase YjiC (YdhE family)
MRRKNITRVMSAVGKELDSKKILITTFGSMGDVNPSIALAGGLSARGHCPTIATSEIYRETVEKAGVGFCGVRPDVDPDDYELIRRLMAPGTGMEILIKEVVLSSLRESYRDLLDASQGTDLLITHPLTFATPLIAEKTRVPWISTALAPAFLISAHDLPVPPLFPFLKKLDSLGPWMGRLLLGLSRLITRGWTEPVRQLRAEIGLPPGKHPLFGGQFSPQMNLGLFSPLLMKPKPAAGGAKMDSPQADSLPGWPPNTRVTGFLFHDGPVDGWLEDPAESTERLEEFLDVGPPPVVFTLGSSAAMAADEFYRDSLGAARILGTRAVLLAGRDLKNRPVEPPPDDIMVLEYVPYSKIFPRAAAIVHHGGIGTTAQALLAGKPMLVVPFAFDQADNAFRVNRLGVSRIINRRRYSAHRAAKELKILLKAPEYSKRAEEAGRAIRSEQGLEAACDAVEELH